MGGVVVLEDAKGEPKPWMPKYVVSLTVYGASTEESREQNPTPD